jgi:hypothetical protein
MKGPLIYYEIQDLYGTDLSSTKLASELRTLILEDIDLGFNVEVDFAGVRSASNGWFKNAFGTIIKNKGAEFFKKHILLSNADKLFKKQVLI